MTAKRLFGVVKGHREHIADHTGRLYSDNEVADLLNTVYEENEQLKTTIQQLRTDNTKQKKKLNTTMKENEQLKEALFFYISVAITETSSHINEDLEKECNQLLKCSYKEALKKSKYE